PLTPPRSIVSSKYTRLRWQIQPRNLAHPLLNAGAVFLHVRARHLDFQHGDPGALCDRAPGIAGNWPWVHGICDDGESEVQVVFSERIGHSIPGIVNRAGHTRIADGLLN